MLFDGAIVSRETIENYAITGGKLPARLKQRNSLAAFISAAAQQMLFIEGFYRMGRGSKRRWDFS